MSLISSRRKPSRVRITLPLPSDMNIFKVMVDFHPLLDVGSDVYLKFPNQLVSGHANKIGKVIKLIDQTIGQALVHLWIESDEVYEELVRRKNCFGGDLGIYILSCQDNDDFRNSILETIGKSIK